MTSAGCVVPGERRWLWGFAAAVLLVTTLPYWIGYVAQGADFRFTGFVFGVEDGNSYIAKMLAGSFGAWKFTSPYTAYPQDGVWFFPLFIWMGKLAAPPGLHNQLVALFQLLRLVAGLLMIFATYDFIAFFIADVRLRRGGTALAILGGGLGYIYYFARAANPALLPLDFYSPEAFGFLSLYGLPHLALARALMLWALLEYLRAVRSVQDNGPDIQPGRATLRLGLLWILIGLAQPLTMLVLGALLVWHLVTLAVWLWIRRLRGLTVTWDVWWSLVRVVVLAGLLPCLFAVYNLWASVFEPYVKLWSAQNLILSPSFGYYILAYGFVIPFAWQGAKILLWHGMEAAEGGVSLVHPAVASGDKQPLDWAGWLPVAWLLLFPLLAYLPVGIQRRLTDGVWVAWVTLAVAGFISLQNRVRANFLRRNLIAVGFLLLFIPTALLLIGGMVTVTKPGLPLFRPVDETRVFEYLQTNAAARAVALADFDTSNALPAWAPVRVLTGHGPESVHLAEVQPRVEAFYRLETPDADRISLLREFGVRYVIWEAPVEGAPAGESWNPAAESYLSEIFTAGKWHLFRVETLP